MKYRIRIPLTALAIAMLTMNAAAQSKQETEKVTPLDSTVPSIWKTVASSTSASTASASTKPLNA